MTAKTPVLTAVLQPVMILSDTKTGTHVLVAKIPLILGTSWLMHNQHCCTVPEVNIADWGYSATMLQDNTTDNNSLALRNGKKQM